MNLERDVGDMLVFICANKNKRRAKLISDKIFKTCERHGVEKVVENLMDRSGTPLILWIIDILKSVNKQKDEVKQ